MKDTIDRCPRHKASVSHDPFGKPLVCCCDFHGSHIDHMDARFDFEVHIRFVITYDVC